MARKARLVGELPPNIESLLVQLEKEIDGDFSLRANVVGRLITNSSERKDHQNTEPTTSLFGAPEVSSASSSGNVPNGRKRKADSLWGSERPSKKQLIERLHKVIVGDDLDAKKSEVKYGDSSQSPLLRLPRELRDMIYPYLLQSDEPIEMSTAEPRRNLDLHPQILATSRLLYEETRTVLYKKNKFCISPLPEPDQTGTTPTFGLKVSQRYQAWLQHVTINMRAFPENLRGASDIVNSGLRDYICTLSRFLAFSKLKSLGFVMQDPGRKSRYQTNFDKYFDFRTPLHLVIEHLMDLPQLTFHYKSTFGFYETLLSREKAPREMERLAYKLQRLGTGSLSQPSVLDDDETRDLKPFIEAEEREAEKENQEDKRRLKASRDIWNVFFEEIEKLLGLDDGLKSLLSRWRW